MMHIRIRIIFAADILQEKNSIIVSGGLNVKSHQISGCSGTLRNSESERVGCSVTGP
jgi:hypothetical protein